MKLYVLYMCMRHTAILDRATPKYNTSALLSNMG